MSYLPTVESIQVGGRVFTDLTNIKVLTAYNLGTFCSAREQGASVGYQVTTGKTFVITAIYHSQHNNSSGSRLSYSDNDLDYGTSTPSVTNEVYHGNTINFLTIPSGVVIDYYRVLKFSVPAGKYININSAGSGGGSTLIFGYEV